MLPDEHDGAGEGRDPSERNLAVSPERQHSSLANQPSRQTSTSEFFRSGTLQSLAVLTTGAAHSTGEENVTDAQDTDDGQTVAGKITGEGSKHRRKTSAALNLSIDTRAVSRQDTVPEARRSPLSPVSPESSPQLHSPMAPLRSPSSSRTRDRGFSLRRVILARNIHGQPKSSASAMELQPTVPSAVQQVSPGSGFGKKSEATITVSPVLETGDDLAHPQSTTKAHESLNLPRYETWLKSKKAHTGLLWRLRAIKERVRKKILRIQEVPPSKDGRHIDIDPNRRENLVDERTGRRYITNSITSSRYTLYNFLPRQLFAQFSKLANFYFLCVSILQMIPGLSTTGTYTTVVPLAFFVVISMAKEGYDDLRRYRLDKAENRKTALVLRGHKVSATSAENVNRSTPTPDVQDHWAETNWEDIGVGDVVKLARDEPAPADLAVLHTNGAEEMAYVETMALDGMYIF